ncbi:NAD(+)/NADH kinase [Candidatus Uabimicrobium sp. HlEnr_7]|uniref:NAD(+)/NADH kinase n=1 Tax=Candidatus Uabimicrobium helgolandensis TaxID=3095367 RepID=UPI003556070F
MEKFAIVADFSKSEVRKAVRAFQSSDTPIKLVDCFEKPEQLDNTIISQKKIEGIIVFGGDGFILSTARQLEAPIPVVGINFGKVGFLTEVSVNELPQCISKIVSGEFVIKKRIMLHCEVIRDGKVINETVALNDGVIKNIASRMICCQIKVNDEEMCTYGGDGVIISTPVGSTAYSMSAGGPVLTPNMCAIVITPICPHTLTMRPVIIPSDNVIEICFYPPYPGGCIFTADGQVYFDIHEHDIIRIKQAERCFHILNTGNRNFFDVLKEKFSWGGKKYLV